MSSGLLQVLSKFLRRSLMIFIIKGYWTIVFIFIVIFTTFRLICPPAFFRCFCLNFWDEAWWFLSLRLFGQLSSSVLLFPQRFGRYVLRPSSGVCCLNFWNEAWWFLSLMVFGLLSSSLLLFSQHFGRYVLRPPSGIFRTSKETIIWRLQVQSSLQASNNAGILNTCTRLWLTESEQVTPVNSIKDVVRSSVKVP